MPRVGFEPTIPMFERSKTVHALDREATAIGSHFLHYNNIHEIKEQAVLSRSVHQH
jgi:hypothetical protein